MIIIKKGFFIICGVMSVVMMSSCELIDNFRQKPETVTTEPVQTVPELEPATVIESFYEEPSNWRPVLPHELDAHFEESEALLKLLRYSRRLNELTPKELDLEYQSFKARPEVEKAAVNMQLQQALLLSATAAPYRDTRHDPDRYNQ
jgi:hypothetical protein